MRPGTAHLKYFIDSTYKLYKSDECCSKNMNFPDITPTNQLIVYSGKKVLVV